MTVDLNKRHYVQCYDNNNVIIEFTNLQDIYPEEEYAGMKAYECYILDDDNEASIRAIYYYVTKDGAQYLKYKEEPDDTTLTTISIQRMLAIEPNKTIEELLHDTEDEPDDNVTMGDIC